MTVRDKPLARQASSLDVYVREVAAAAAPVLSPVVPSTSELWPPNGQIADVTLSYRVTPGGSQPLCQTSVASNQAAGGQWQVVNAQHVRLRAQRSGESARVHTITVRCVDDEGQAVGGSAHVTVPHDRRGGQ